MPYPNEHSCRLADPGQFDRFARKNGEQEHDGKKIDVIYGVKDGKSSIQALRYNKDTWSEQSARTHCKGREGTFEAATKESKEAIMVTKLSNENIKNLLQAALYDEYGLKTEDPKPKSLTISEVFEREVIYEIDGQLYQTSYELLDGDTPTFGEPKKVLSTKIYKTMESLSMENRRSILDASLHDYLGLGNDDFAWIEDMTETEVIYRHNQQSYKAPYVIAEDMTVTFGDSIEVTRQVTYKAMEAIQKVYSEIIQEAGKRNAQLDAGRIKKILEICQELLSSEDEPDEKVTKAAVKEAKSVLTWLKEQPATKTEDGESYPAAAFAYVPDADKSSTWKLRIWEDPTLKVTRAQLGRAAAAFSPGGFRGQKVTIPADDIAAVKRKIRSEYRKLDVEDEDIPRQVRESWSEVPGKGTVWKGSDEKRELVLHYTPLTEAKYEDKGRATVIVIKAGFNATGDRYYPAEMLKRDYGIFEGMKMFADHPTEAEDDARPERSIRDWVATLKEVTCDDEGTVTGISEVWKPWMQLMLASLRDKKMLSEMGISINAVGSASKGTVEGKETMIIEKLVSARSVDFVTEPGAGGIVTMYESDRGHDIDLIELSSLKERRPDLVKIIEADVRAEITEEVKKAMENEELIKEKDEQIATLTKERDDLKEANEKAAKDILIAEAEKAVREALDGSELPEVAKERVQEKYKDAESADGITEAIQAEKDYIAKLSEAGKVTNLGGSKPENDTEKDKTALRESFKRNNPDWTEKQLDDAVNA